jgi:hypothetical protein
LQVKSGAIVVVVGAAVVVVVGAAVVVVVGATVVVVVDVVVEVVVDVVGVQRWEDAEDCIDSRVHGGPLGSPS